MEFCLGNPEKIEGDVKCRHCPQVNFISQKTMVIDNKSRSEAKAILDKYKYFMTKCAKCGAERFLIHPFFYVANSFKINGVEYGQWAIQLVNDGKEALEFANYIDELRKMPEHKDDWTTYRVRVVWNRDDFYEKLRIVISLADDRVIEHLRKRRKEELEKQTGKKVIRSKFLFEDGKMTICFEFKNFDDDVFEINQENYQNALDELAKTLIMNNDDDIIVNHEMFDTKYLFNQAYKPIHQR
ncbi:MAG: hypothetical protein BWY30_00552 [Tenericutes bacterium ADurb.Bin239]|nr:MAG: hypothetical protein BWY30_00552 [Tenericutes bacterium ADurb.Bin239]